MAGGNDIQLLANGGATRMHQSARRCILAVFAHPDDETSTAAGTFTKHAREGVDIHVVTATRGERGGPGTGDLKIERRDLPTIREAELRAVLTIYGGQPANPLGLPRSRAHHCRLRDAHPRRLSGYGSGAARCGDHLWPVRYL